MSTEQEVIRREKLEALSQMVKVYPDRYPVSHSLEEARLLNDGVDEIRVAGRILSMRKMGKLTFVTIGDVLSKLQLAFKEDALGADRYDFLHRYFDIGDHIGAEGISFTTRTGEKTIQVLSFLLLGKCLKVLPEKWHGLTDIESCYRQRYLDLIMSQQTRERFLIKSAVIRELRRYLEESNFIEVETPVLQTKPSGNLSEAAGSRRLHQSV
jgi:lysyl-tRNA synthetase, class II